jgi:predicted deacylase
MHIRDFSLTALSRTHRETGWFDIASRADSGQWRLPYLTVTGATTGPTLVVIAGVHGDEYEGVETVPRVFEAVRPEALVGTLMMIPVCNMPAYEAGLRSSPIDGLNLARVFPGVLDGTITERIAYWITEKLLKHADFLIDLHSGGIAYNIPTLIGYIHDSGELGQRSRAGAEAFGLSTCWGHPLPLAPGRSLSAATDLNVPSVYTEAPGGGYARAETVTQFADGVINIMRHLEMLAGEPESRPVSYDLLGDGNLDSVISAPEAGYFRPAIALLDSVAEGDVMGHIQDFFGHTVAEITADRDGVVIMLRRLHRVHVGDGLVHLTGYNNG